MSKLPEKLLAVHGALYAEAWAKHSIQIPISYALRLIELDEKREANKEIAAAITGGFAAIAASIRAAR